MHDVNSAIGPLLMASVIQMVPYGVLVLDRFSNAKNLEDIPWLDCCIMTMKLGHILLAAEAAANVRKISIRGN